MVGEWKSKVTLKLKGVNQIFLTPPKPKSANNEPVSHQPEAFDLNYMPEPMMPMGQEPNPANNSSSCYSDSSESDI